MQTGRRDQIVERWIPRRETVEQLPERGGLDLHLGETDTHTGDTEELDDHGGVPVRRAGVSA